MVAKQPKKPRARGPNLGPPNKGGRPRGALDQGNKLLRDMLAQSLDELGGVKWLVSAAKKNPGAYLALIGKLLPLQVQGAGGGPVVVMLTEADARL